MQPITHSKPWITEDDRRAVAQVLTSSMIAQGEVCRGLERRFASWVGAADGVATSSGSAAIVLALKGIGIGAGDEVLMPSYVCRSVLEAVLAVDAIPALCDVGEDWVITAEAAARQLTPKTKAIIAAHIYGVFADIEAMRTLGVPIIEDCAQALDDDRRRPLRSDVAIFSFHPTKCLTAGEGGLAASADLAIVDRMRCVRDGGGPVPRARLFSPLSDLAAGLALSQLNRYPEMLSKRRDLAIKYRAALESAASVTINRSALARSMFFRFPVLVNGGLESCQRAFLERGIHVRRGVDELLHRLIGQRDGDFPTATELFRTTVSLPIYPALSSSEESHCIRSAAEVFSRLH